MPAARNNVERLKDLKKAIEKKEEPLDLKKIVERFKKKEEIEGVPSERVSALKRGLAAEGRGEFRVEKDVTRIDKGPLALPAKVYASFKGPLSKVAQALSGMPFMQTLKASLDSAGIRLSVENYLALVSASAFIAGVAAFFLFALLGAALGDAVLVALAPVMALAGFGLVVGGAVLYPAGLAEERARQIDRVLPFALRQLATQVKAGVSFHQALRSVAQTDYGVLSRECERVLTDLANGLPTDEALQRFSNRTQSKGMKKALTQIIRAFKTGGSLSKIISDIADDVSFETRMSIRDFTERLNFINIIYIMVAVVAPVGAAILSSVMQIPMFAGGLPPYFIYVAFGGIVVGMVMILFVTKRLEPVAW